MTEVKKHMRTNYKRRYFRYFISIQQKCQVLFSTQRKWISQMMSLILKSMASISEAANCWSSSLVETVTPASGKGDPVSSIRRAVREAKRRARSSSTTFLED